MSLHGARGETHDRATATAGSFEALFRGADRLRARGVEVVLKTPLTRLNEDEIEGMERLADERGLALRLDPVLTPRDDGDPGPLAFRASAAAVAHAYARLVARGLGVQEERVAGGTNCGLGRTTLAIDPEGFVFPCLQWRRVPLGNVRETPLPAMWARSAERAHAAEVARRANDLLVAEGGALATFPYCPALALQETGDPLRPAEAHRERALIAASSVRPR
jgi:MoaA/NifB/PqqE/SkfB family radical SAM enzyme